jgi:hypothetical protein
MDGEIRRLSEPPLRVSAGGLPGPSPAALSEPPPPVEPPAPAAPDLEAARREVREEFAIRRLAQPDRAQEDYERELAALRRRARQIRRETMPDRSAEDLERALRHAEEYARLRDRLFELREIPGVDYRLFYPPEQLRRRRELYRQTELEIEALRRQKLEHLRRAVRRPIPRRRPSAAAIPPERAAELAALEERRKEFQARAEAELSRMETEALERVSSVRPPAPPDPEPPPALEGEEGGAGRVRLAEASARAAAAPAGARGPALRAAIDELRRRREQLHRAILEDVKAAAAAAGRERSIALTFKPGAAPDRTADLTPDVRRILQSSTGPRGRG